MITVTGTSSATMEERDPMAILKEVREFVDQEIRPHAATFEEEERIPRSLIAKMAARGYLAACFPKEYGGLGLDTIQYGMFTEEIAKGCSSVRAMLTVHSSLVGETLLRWGTEAQKQEFLPAMARGEKLASFALTEPETGTDAKNIQTQYRKEGNEYVIDGQKKWITLSAIADVFVVIARQGDLISAFLVDRSCEGITTKPMRGLLASKAAHVAEITFDQVRIPADRMLGKEGSGFTYIINTALDFGRYSIAWGGLGIAQAALEEMVRYSRSRKQFGQPIYQFQLIKGLIGNAVTQIHAARSLCRQAGQMRQEKHPDATMETNIAKYFTSTMATKVASDAIQIHGGNGCHNHYPVERLFREAKILEIIEGTSQIQQEFIADFGLIKYRPKKRRK